MEGTRERKGQGKGRLLGSARLSRRFPFLACCKQVEPGGTRQREGRRKGIRERKGGGKGLRKGRGGIREVKGREGKERRKHKFFFQENINFYLQHLKNSQQIFMFYSLRKKIIHEMRA